MDTLNQDTQVPARDDCPVKGPPSSQLLPLCASHRDILVYTTNGRRVYVYIMASHCSRLFAVREIVKIWSAATHQHRLICYNTHRMLSRR